MDYKPYKLASVYGQSQLLLGTMLVFGLALYFKLFPLKSDRTILDADWLYRRFGDASARWGAAMGQLLFDAIGKVLGAFISFVRLRLFNLFSPAGALSKEFPSGMMALWTAIMLAGVVLVAYFSPV